MCDGLPSVALYLDTPTFGKGFRSRSMDAVTLRNDPRFVKGGGLRQRASKRKGFKVQENLMGVKDLIDKKGLERTQQEKKTFRTTQKESYIPLFSADMTLIAHVLKKTNTFFERSNAFFTTRVLLFTTCGSVIFNEAEKSIFEPPLLWL